MVLLVYNTSGTFIKRKKNDFMEIGKINNLKVARKTDLGYMLTNGKEEVFLHYNETNYQELKIGEYVEAFLYYDFKNRLAATLYKPIIERDKSAFLKVVGVNYTLGVFVDIGIKKDLLISFDELPNNKKLWPREDDILYVTLKVKQRLVGKLVKKGDIVTAPTNTVKEKEEFTGYVIEINPNGLNILTKDFHLIFVHHTQKRKDYRLGEKVKVVISRVHDKVLHGTFILQKELMIDVDAKSILDYLKEHGKMKLTSDSSPEEIKKLFSMSKRAFKRALGSIYKQDLVEFENNYTIYIGDKNE
jgi:predicted RNA-binding protein (virulence factor B family)